MHHVSTHLPIISIHTPARGVTLRSETPEDSPGDFNPHSREGSDGKSQYPRLPLHHFNPHSREGSDTSIWRRIAESTHFNPHSREGSDIAGRHVQHHIMISIHTPARGVTQVYRCVEPDEFISIHTPARGVTKVWAVGHWVYLFQSTLPRGE